MTNIWHRLHTAATISFSFSTSSGTNEVTVLQWLPKLDWLERLSLRSRLLGGELKSCLAWLRVNFFRAWLLDSWCSSDCTHKKVSISLVTEEKKQIKDEKDYMYGWCRWSELESNVHFFFMRPLPLLGRQIIWLVLYLGIRWGEETVKGYHRFQTYWWSWNKEGSSVYIHKVGDLFMRLI